MRFFDRAKEIALLRQIRAKSVENAQFTVLTGRRRVGKTSLVRKAYSDEPFLYLFVERKSEKDLCEVFQQEIEAFLGEPLLGRAEEFSRLFEILMKRSQHQPLTVVIDEFQEFLKVNKSVFSSIQKIWDLNKDGSKINLVVIGSVNTLMRKIFFSYRASLYGRATSSLMVRPFAVSVLKQILAEYKKDFSREDLLALWTFTGGVAKYVEILIDEKAFSRDAMIDVIVRDGSPFINEGRLMLAEEFAKEYSVYFSILSAIARGKTERNEIEQVVGKAVSGYLSRLENDYGIIVKRLPIFAKDTAKASRYVLDDNFLIFWFRFVFKYSFMLEIGEYGKLREIIRRDYDVFSGLALERYFKAAFVESNKWTRIGSWWDRKDENEIGLIAENELDGTYAVCEIKRDRARIDLDTLKEKYSVFTKVSGKWKRAKPEFLTLSLDDM